MVEQFNPPTSTPGLTPENYRELAEARTALKKIRRAVGKARFDGWFLAASAVVSFMLGYDNVTGWVVTIAFVIMMVVEFRAATQLLRLEPKSIPTLAINQIVMGVFLGAYFLKQIQVESSGSGMLNDPMLVQALQGRTELIPQVQQIVISGYWAILAVTVAYCGLFAIYFFSRASVLRRYLQETPDWIVQMQRAGVSI
jgi:hypothetical protein